MMVEPQLGSSESEQVLALVTMIASASASTADIRPLLREQGFIRPINGRETIKYAGHIKQGGHDYQIYVYRGLFRAAVVDHGSNDIIVIRDGSTYLGEYHVAMPTRCKVRGRKVVCDAHSPGRVIKFTRQGPPRQIWFDGAVDEMEFGNRLKGYHRGITGRPR
jgi:hypothetical protein